MRHWVVGLSLLAAVACIAQPSSASVIQNPNIFFGSPDWSFSTSTNLFSGGGGGQAAPPAPPVGVLGGLLASFDDQGDFQSGVLVLLGGSDSHVALVAKVTDLGLVSVIQDPPGVDQHYFLRADFVTIAQDPSGLPFPVQFGFWDIFVCSQTGDCETDGPASAAGLFTTDYSDSHVPLNNNLHSFYVRVPAPLSLVLVAIGLGATALRRRVWHG